MWWSRGRSREHGIKAAPVERLSVWRWRWRRLFDNLQEVGIDVAEVRVYHKRWVGLGVRALARSAIGAASPVLSCQEYGPPLLQMERLARHCGGPAGDVELA